MYCVRHKHVSAFISCERHMYVYVSFIPMRWNVAVKWVSPFLHTQVCQHSNYCHREGSGCSLYKLPGPGSPKRGLGPDGDAYVFVCLGCIIICPLYIQINPFVLNPSHSATVSLYDLV